MADNLGPMAWLLLPENEQAQYLQKIALRAENPSGLRHFEKLPFSPSFYVNEFDCMNKLAAKIRKI